MSFVNLVIIIIMTSIFLCDLKSVKTWTVNLWLPYSLVAGRSTGHMSPNRCVNLPLKTNHECNHRNAKKKKKIESQSIQKELLTSLTSLALWLSAATVVHAPTGHTSLLSASLQALESHISLLDFLPSLSLQLSHVCSQLWVKMNWVCWVNSLIVLYETKT